jgi:hypothetical protein
MSDPVTSLRMQPDKFRISAYYDEQGRATNVDFVINAEVSTHDLAVLADYLRRHPNTPPTPPAWGGDSQTISAEDGTVIRTFNCAA